MADITYFRENMPMPQPKFKVGDEVKFINNGNGRNTPEYYYERSGIPGHMIKHGVSTLRENYKAKVVNFFNEFIIVEFEDERIEEENRTTILGFKEKDLELDKVLNWKKRMEG